MLAEQPFLVARTKHQLILTLVLPQRSTKTPSPLSTAYSLLPRPVLSPLLLDSSLVLVFRKFLNSNPPSRLVVTMGGP